ncbi:MAG: GTP pyrophosphokinase family protein [Peptococcaceae bacterium]|nr:GTP pyrophosphokinase family protein [Peptococcaceae bacterium]
MDIKQLEEYVLNSDLAEVLAQDELLDYMHNQVFEFRKLMAYYRCAMMEIETKFHVINEDFSYQFERNPIQNIKSRLKEPQSIHDKLAKRGLLFSAEEIEKNLFDVAGVRVICSFVDDVYKIADALTRQDDITLVERKDYIENPKENGYRSLHLIVAVPIFLTNEKKIMNVEIQLRTIAMDFWASLDHDLRYKKEHLLTEQMVGDLKKCADVSTALDEMMNDMCAQVYRANPPQKNNIRQLAQRLGL